MWYWYWYWYDNQVTCNPVCGIGKSYIFMKACDMVQLHIKSDLRIAIVAVSEYPRNTRLAADKIQSYAEDQNLAITKILK